MEQVNRTGRMRGAAVAGLLVAIGILAVPDTGRACKPATNEPFSVVDSGTDSVPPGDVTASVEAVTLAAESGAGAGDCGTTSFVRLLVSASDDQAASDKLGYQVTLLCGDLPPVEDVPVKPLEGRLFYAWNSSGETAFHSRLGVSAVDRAGNVGPMTTLDVSAGDAEECSTSTEGSCSMSSHARGGLWSSVVCLLAGLALARRRRR